MRKSSLALQIQKMRRAVRTQNILSFSYVITNLVVQSAKQKVRDRIWTRRTAFIKPLIRTDRSVDEPVTIVIPFRDGGKVLEVCIESILAKTSYTNYTILLVDNQSSEPETRNYLTRISENSRVRVLTYDQPFNYAALHNWVMEFVDTEYVLLLNNDTEIIHPEWLESMMSWIVEETVGAVGALLLFPNSTVQHGGVGLYPEVAYHLDQGRPYDFLAPAPLAPLELAAVTAACLLTKKSLYTAVGGMDAEHLAINLNDIDYCLRLREAGYMIVYEPAAVLYHYESYSRGAVWMSAPKYRSYRKEVQYFWRRWRRFVRTMSS